MRRRIATSNARSRHDNSDKRARPKQQAATRTASGHDENEELPDELSELEEVTEIIEQSELLSREEAEALWITGSEESGEAPGGFEHEYELHEATGAEGGTPDRTLEFAPRDHVPDLDTVSVAPDELGHFYLERAVQDSHSTEDGEPANPDDEERIKRGERTMLHDSAGQAVQVGGLAVRLPDRSEVEAELSEKAERIAQRSRKAAEDGNLSPDTDDEDPSEPISRAVLWRARHERQRKPRAKRVKKSLFKGRLLRRPSSR